MDRRHENAKATLEATFSGWYPTLVRYANRLMGAGSLAEDLVQEVFVRLYEELAAGRVVENPRAWTLVVLRREIGKRWKTHKATTSIEDLPPMAAPESFGDDDLARLLAVLTPREAEVLLLRLEGLRYEEIASHLDITTNTVSTLLVRGMRKLRDAVRPPGGGPSASKPAQPPTKARRSDEPPLQ